MFRLPTLAACGLLLYSAASFAVEPATVPTDQPGSVRLLLPPQIPAVVGQECNVYFDNVTLVMNPANWGFDVDSRRGQQQTERWTWTPTDQDVGEHPLILRVLNQENQVVATAQTTVTVVPADRNLDRSLSVLCIGDSLTHASRYTQRLLDLSAEAGHPNISLIGSHWIGEASPNRHEGYGGWTAKRFATHFTDTARKGPYAQRGSPFLYRDQDEQPRLDFPRYCEDVNQGMFPDVVTIFLGPNDIFSLTDDSLETGIDEMLQHMDLLVEMLSHSNDRMCIALMLPVPPAATQDAFGANYGAGQTRWQYKRNQHRLVERMFERYGHREAERIHLIPIYVNLDCLHNYPSDTVHPNARNGDATTSRLNNGVHPSAAGYDQIGDTLFAWLKSL